MTDKIYTQARYCYNDHCDESERVKVVNTVFESIKRNEKGDTLRVQSIQTQTIDRSVLPQHPFLSFAKKADLALAFSCENRTVAAAIEPVRTANPDVNLSQMTDAYTSTVPLVCGVEVKERGGDYNEAIIR